MSKGAEQWFSPGDVLPPGTIWQDLEVFLVGIIGRRFYWHLIGRDQGRC